MRFLGVSSRYKCPSNGFGIVVLARLTKLSRGGGSAIRGVSILSVCRSPRTINVHLIHAPIHSASSVLGNYRTFLETWTNWSTSTAGDVSARNKALVSVERVVAIGTVLSSLNTFRLVIVWLFHSQAVFCWGSRTRSISVPYELATKSTDFLTCYSTRPRRFTGQVESA